MGSETTPDDVRLTGLRSLVRSDLAAVHVTEAEVRRVEAPRCTTMIVLSYATIAEAGDATPGIIDRPTACEGLDAQIVEVVRQRRGKSALPDLPTGAALLFVELAAGSVQAEVEPNVQAAVAEVPEREPGEALGSSRASNSRR